MNEVILSKKELNNKGEIWVVSLLCKLEDYGLKSHSVSRRFIYQKAIKINGIIKNDMMELVKINDGDIVEIGNKRKIKIKLGE